MHHCQKIVGKSYVAIQQMVNGQSSCPYGVAFDSAGHIIVADTRNHRVQVLRYSDGSHVRTIGSEGRGNGQFRFPWGVVIDGQGRIIVSEYRNDRIQLLQ